MIYSQLIKNTSNYIAAIDYYTTNDRHYNLHGDCWAVFLVPGGRTVMLADTVPGWSKRDVAKHRVLHGFPVENGGSPRQSVILIN